MALSSFDKQTVVVLTPLLIEERGQVVEDWSNPVRTPVHGCSAQPGGGGASFENEQALDADYTVYFPPETALPRSFRLELPHADGEFMLAGEPEPWIFGFHTDHIRVRVRRRDG